MSRKMQWLPIETAPKDGSPVLAMRREWKIPDIVSWRNGGFGHASWPYDKPYKHQPTHWMPLPEPPEDEE